MKFWEAMKAAEEGKLVRQKKWSPKCYWGKKDSNCCAITLSWCFWEEWEIYDESERTLSFAEVVKGLKVGKKFKRPSWDCFVQLTEIDSVHKTDREELTVWDFEATDWVEV